MDEQAEYPLEGLEERLQNHARAFDSLLALTPAREYYGSQIDDGLDPSEQWNRKKQTKEQKRAAKKAKLDPANQKTALDVMKDREKKRKRELSVGEKDEGHSIENTSQEPGSKKQKQQQLTQKDDDTIRRQKAEQRRDKRKAKKEKAAGLKAKKEAKKAEKHGKDLLEAQAGNEQIVADVENGDEEDEDEDESAEQIEPADMEHLDFAGLVDSSMEQNEDGNVGEDTAEVSSVPTSPGIDSPAFDIATNHSETSSSSSIVPPSGPESHKEQTRLQKSSAKSDLTLDITQSTPATSVQEPASFNDLPSGISSPKLQLPDVDPAQLQERLRKRIEELRQRRKADGMDGKPAKSRQELLEQRRKKEEQRKAHKKELRRQAKEEDARKRESQLRGSGSPLSGDIFSRNSPRLQENSFSFSRLAFDDGTAVDASLSELRDPKKKKGPQDPHTALQAAEKKQSRLAGLDAEKRADIADKDMWLNAKKRAHGERVRDDTSLLKKALKRKEKQKGKSEKEWKDREQAVIKGREAKQKKRETNLQKRRDEKGQKGKKKPSGGKGKKKARPGFEGRFKA